ncbi:MAG: hypothetical protein LBQ74_12995 [Prevotella sp.]|nr:hypothetical protein [Prevotella sp.]
MILRPPYSFIQFSDELHGCRCAVRLEVAAANDLSFFVFSDHTMQLYLCDMSGDVITKIGDYPSGWIIPDINLSAYLACKDCFRLMIVDNDTMYYSDILIYDEKTDHPLVVYRSKNTSFFPFVADTYCSVRLPIDLINENPSTDSEEYTDANGRIHNPYKMRRQQYDMRVNYCPVDFHKKIEVMLMHDVTIDDKEIIETGDYEIDYDNELEEGDSKYYKASTEVSAQDVLMMRNY